MPSPTIARTWRKCLADLYEQDCGVCFAFIRIPFEANKSLLQPLPDPVPTFGADLITAPSTPVLSASMAKPDPDFLKKLDQGITVALATLSPDYDSDFDSSSDDEDCAPWSPRAHAAWCFKMAAAPRVIRKDQKRKCSNGRKDKHSVQYTQPHKRARRITKLGKTSFSQPKQLSRSAKEHHSLYSPPQTPSQTTQASPKDGTNSAQSKESLASQPPPSMQQPPPEADESLLQRELGQKSAWPPLSPADESGLVG
ncbi:hypothetical protein HYE68_001228 [Fusarium pseudograminearum]|nr:hypothetical protein HYE68_001228 [Fusarium pseudograminearum]